MKNTVIIFYGLFEPNQKNEWVPYGPVVLYSKLKAAGFNPVLIHEFTQRDYEDVIRQHLPDLLWFGVSAMTGHQIRSGLNAIDILRKYTPETPVIWGGAHVTAMPLQSLQSDYVDYVCVGMAENNIVEFTQRIQRGEVPSGIPDILDKSATANSKNGAYNTVSYPSDTSMMPDLALDDFDFSYVITENKVFNYFASVGCPGQCTFCSWGGTHKWLPFQVERAIKDIIYLHDRYKFETLWLSDSTFFANKDFVMEFAAALKKTGLDIFWRCNARIPEMLKFTRDDYRFLADCGLDQVFAGIENISKPIQTMYRKHFSPESVSKVVEMIDGLDIHVFMSFIFGNPGDTFDDIAENKKWLMQWMEINSNVKYQVCIYAPYPGTPVTELAIERGYDAPKRLEDYPEDVHFSTKHRDVYALPWMDGATRDSYINRYFELFPARSFAQEFSWRRKQAACATV